MQSWGYRPVPCPIQCNPRGYLAGSDDERLAATVWALSDPDLDAAWLTRGGYGITRLLPRLPWEELRPRPVLGFSDATALLFPLWRRGWSQLIHAPVVHSLADRPDRDRLERLLAEGAVPDLPGSCVVPGRAVGPLIGGNLCVLASMTGTPEQLRSHGCILLIEDITEQPYRLDRYLTQLRHASCFEGVAAIALGEFTDCGVEAEATVLDEVQNLGVPVTRGLNVGHGASNTPFAYGALYRLDEDGLSLAEDL